jgi:hypothetical protein
MYETWARGGVTTAFVTDEEGTMGGPGIDGILLILLASPTPR